MTITAGPLFIDSPFFVDEPGHWHLKCGAPPEIIREFNAFMKATAPIEPPDVDLEELHCLIKAEKGTGKEPKQVL